MAEPLKVGRRGTVVIPASLRRRFGLDEGAVVLVEAREEGVLLRPAVVAPLEVYTPQRRAEFLLTNAVDDEEYRWAMREVRRMGLDPKKIRHTRPTGA